MRKPKAFDCVKMKTDIQQKLHAECPDMDEMEKRRVQLDRVRQNPILGPILQKIKVLQLHRPGN